jgi:cytochrome P450
MHNTIQRWLIAAGDAPEPTDIVGGFKHKKVLLFFGTGPRSCPGQTLATVELKVRLLVPYSYY